MQGRVLLQALINNFNIENLKNFFQNVNESFMPSSDSYSHFKDETQLNLSQIQKIGEIEFNDSERLIVIAANTEKELTTKSGKNNNMN